MSELLPMLVEVLLPAIMAIAMYYLTRLGHAGMVKLKASDAEKDAFTALMAGVEHAQQVFVEDIKAMGGKLDAAARQQALDLAMAHALSVAKGPGKDLLITMGRERVGAWVKTILARWK